MFPGDGSVASGAPSSRESCRLYGFCYSNPLITLGRTSVFLDTPIDPHPPLHGLLQAHKICESDSAPHDGEG